MTPLRKAVLRVVEAMRRVDRCDLERDRARRNYDRLANAKRDGADGIDVAIGFAHRNAIDARRAWTCAMAELNAANAALATAYIAGLGVDPFSPHAPSEAERALERLEAAAEAS